MGNENLICNLSDSVFYFVQSLYFLRNHIIIPSYSYDSKFVYFLTSMPTLQQHHQQFLHTSDLKMIHNDSHQKLIESLSKKSRSEFILQLKSQKHSQNMMADHLVEILLSAQSSKFCFSLPSYQTKNILSNMVEKYQKRQR